MLRQIFLTLVLTANLPMLSPGQSWNETITAAYLANHPSTDPWLALGLAPFGQTQSVAALETTTLDNPDSFLKVAKTILALRANGLPVNRLDVEIANAPAITGVFNTELWRLISQLANNQTLTPAQVQFVENAQDATIGGWRIDSVNIPDTDTTALALMILGQSGGTTNVIQNGLAFLAARKDGNGFGFSAERPQANTASTAWAVMAYWIVAPTHDFVNPALNFLASQQQPNGSFALTPGGTGNALWTAYAVLALRHEAFPVSRRAFGDFDNSSTVDLTDFLFLLDNWQNQIRGSPIGVADFLALLDNWNPGGTS
jgi:hypothetical protein